MSLAHARTPGDVLFPTVIGGLIHAKVIGTYLPASEYVASRCQLYISVHVEFNRLATS